MKISVIIPVYNCEKYLKQCLDSFVNQTEKDLEIICVDDGSTDTSPKILQEYVQKDERIQVITQKNQGAGEARNNGLKIATGEYIYFFDSDDWAELNLCEEVYKIAVSQKKPDIIKFHGYNFNIQTNKKFKNSNLNNIPDSLYNEIVNFKNHTDDLLNYTAVPWNSFYKREFISSNNIKFSNLKCGNDISFFLHTLIKAETIFSVNRFFVYHRTNNNDSLVGKRDKYFECEFENYEIVDNFTKDIDENLRRKVLKFMFDDIYFWYKRFINKSSNNKKIYKLTKQFLKNKNLKYFISDERLSHFIIMKYGTFFLCSHFFKFITFKEVCINTYNNIFCYDNRQFVLMHTPQIFYPFLLKRWYKLQTGKNLDLKRPKTFNEKIQWLKLYDSTPLKTKLADKYEVREWIKEKIGDEYLIPLLGVWNKFDDIDFDKLPNQFVLKATHGSAMNIIVKDKSKLDRNEVKEKIDYWLKINYAYEYGYQLHYKNIKPRIIAEEYKKDLSHDLMDYKVLCFDGKPECIWVDSNRYSGHKRNVFDLEWNELQVTFHHYRQAKHIEKPVNFNRMIEISELLSKGFKHVRVDFYETNGKLYFGEMTFTSSSGTEQINPPEFDLELGKLIKLPIDKEK